MDTMGTLTQIGQSPNFGAKMSLGAGSVAGGAQIGQALAAPAQARFEAEQLRRQGTAALINSQTQSQNAAERAAEVQGTMRARAAASGAGGGSASYLSLGDIMARKASTQERAPIARGLTAMDTANTEANAAIQKGNAQRTAGLIGGGATILSAIGKNAPKLGASTPTMGSAWKTSVNPASDDDDDTSIIKPKKYSYGYDDRTF